MFSGAKIVQIFRSTKCLTVFLVIILNTEARRHREYIFKFSEDTEKLNSVVIYKTQRHRHDVQLLKALSDRAFAAHSHHLDN